MPSRQRLGWALLLLACRQGPAQAYNRYMANSHYCKSYFPLDVGVAYMDARPSVASAPATFALSVTNTATGEAVPSSGAPPAAGTELTLSVTGTYLNPNVQLVLDVIGGTFVLGKIPDGTGDGEGCGKTRVYFTIPSAGPHPTATFVVDAGVKALYLAAGAAHIKETPVLISALHVCDDEWRHQDGTCMTTAQLTLDGAAGTDWTIVGLVITLVIVVLAAAMLYYRGRRRQSKPKQPVRHNVGII